MTRAKRRFRAILWPLAFYFAGTLGEPILNGSSGRREFWTHGAAVVAVAACCLLARVAGWAVSSGFRRMSMRGG